MTRQKLKAVINKENIDGPKRIDGHWSKDEMLGFARLLSICFICLGKVEMKLESASASIINNSLLK